MNKRALVSGGSGGIGRAICRRLAEEGLHILVHANRNLAAAEAVAEDIRRADGSAEAIAFDLTDAAATAAAVEALLAAGPVQVLVNNAGVHDDAVFPGMSATQWHSVMDVSLNGFFNFSNLFYRFISFFSYSFSIFLFFKISPQNGMPAISRISL